MATHSYGLLDQAQEDALHASRLLQVEERPFQRVTRNLLSKDSLLKWTPPTQLPSPPPEGSSGYDKTPTLLALAPSTEEEEKLKRQKFTEDILLDFAALESSILRLQLTLTSNARERTRYAAEKAKILSTASSVRSNTLALRAQLAEAQRVLSLRKGYDELAAKLIDPKKLKPRAETTEEIERLGKEIEELEQESADFEGVWVGRREGFERVVAEGRAMVRLIKGVKEEVEPEVEVEGGEEGKVEGRSRMGTPVPSGSTPIAEGEGTPMPTGGEETPLHAGGVESGEGGASPMRVTNKFLEVEDATRASSRAASPVVQLVESQEEADVEMGEDSVALEPQPKTTGGMEVTEDQVKTHEGTQGTEEPDKVATPAEGMVEEMDES